MNQINEIATKEAIKILGYMKNFDREKFAEAKRNRYRKDFVPREPDPN